MNWDAIAAKFERVRTGETDFQKKNRGLRRRLTLLLAVVGPGLMTSNVANDGGGVCRRGGGDANFRDQPIRRRADRRDPRLGAGDSRDLPPSGDYFSVRLRSVSVVRIFRIFRQAGLADRRERNSDPEPQP